MAERNESSAASSFLSVDECRSATEILNKGAEILEARADVQEAGGDKRRAESTRDVAGAVLNVMDLLTNGTGRKDLWLAERSGWWNE